MGGGPLPRIIPEHRRRLPALAADIVQRAADPRPPRFSTRVWIIVVETSLWPSSGDHVGNRGREHPSPAPLVGGAWVPALDRHGQPDTAGSARDGTTGGRAGRFARTIPVSHGSRWSSTSRYRTSSALGGLVLGRGTQPAVNGEAGRVRRRLRAAHPERVPPAVAHDEPADPADPALLGATAQVAHPRGGARPGAPLDPRPYSPAPSASSRSATSAAISAWVSSSRSPSITSPSR